MHLIRHTNSFCPTCFLEIPAVIKLEKDGVWMSKTCPVHGETRAMVERDPLFYSHAISLQATQIYPGYFVDVIVTIRPDTKDLAGWTRDEVAALLLEER